MKKELQEALDDTTYYWFKHHCSKNNCDSCGVSILQTHISQLPPDEIKLSEMINNLKNIITNKKIDIEWNAKSVNDYVIYRSDKYHTSRLIGIKNNKIRALYSIPSNDDKDTYIWLYDMWRYKTKIINDLEEKE